MIEHPSAFHIVLLIACTWMPFFSQAQSNPASEADHELWSIKKNKGMFGLAKPDFGPYSTINIIKLDSPVHRQKIKDPDGAAISVSGSEGVDVTKQQTITKQKWYKLLLGSGTDTIEAVFAIISVSKERKQTLLGKMMRKNEESSSAVLSYNRDVEGMVAIKTDTTTWNFFIDDFTSGGRQTEERQWPLASIAAVYLKNDRDSFYTKLQGMRSSDVVLYKNDTEKLAALEFSGKTASIWVRHDLERTSQQAVAALFAVIVAIKDL